MSTTISIWFLNLHILFEGLRTSCAWSAEGGIQDEAFWSSQRSLEELWPCSPGVGVIHRSVTTHQLSIIFVFASWQRAGMSSQEVSCIANGWRVYLKRTRAPNMCAQLPVLVASVPHLAPHDTAAPHKPEWRASLFVSPLQNRVHFLCSLCFRANMEKKKKTLLKTLCLHCVSTLRESTKPPHSGWIINLDWVSNRLNL